MTWFNVPPNSYVMIDERGNLIWYLKKHRGKWPGVGVFQDNDPTLNTCECGSGSNLRGEGHSDWCKLYETERY